MPGLQWRSNKGENTNTFDLPFDSPGKFKLKVVRTGVGIAVSLAKDGAELRQVARTEVTFRSPILVGLVVCSHKADASDTVIFSDVSVEQLAPPAGKKQ
jgi:regulation of enolase protein 1 (concanavalin A-like superfamily)